MNDIKMILVWFSAARALLTPERRDEEGASMAEYVILVALIAGAVITLAGVVIGKMNGWAGSIPGK